MNKVFVVNRGCHDHSDAERFGELVYLSEGSINRYATGKMYREFIEPLKKSGPEDYILTTGLTIMSVIACSIFARMHGRLNLLLFKSLRKPDEESYYVERTVVLDELLKEDEVEGIGKATAKAAYEAINKEGE